jgi:tetratricopeptide (TPR) repeat protein
LDPQNPFTLNNLGVANESIGDYDSALKFYAEASASHSSEPAVVTLDRAWRGKSVSAMASASEKRLEDRMKKMNGSEEHAVMFTMRGVSATNANDWVEAREDFLHAYSLDPSSAFSLNNRGFVAEMDGDLETAQFYYDKAREAETRTPAWALRPSVPQRAKSSSRLPWTAIVKSTASSIDIASSGAGRLGRLN